MNYLTHEKIEVGKMYQCLSATYDGKEIVNGPVLIIKKCERVVKLLYNTKIVVIFLGDYKFSNI